MTIRLCARGPPASEANGVSPIAFIGLPNRESACLVFTSCRSDPPGSEPYGGLLAATRAGFGQRAAGFLGLSSTLRLRPEGSLSKSSRRYYPIRSPPPV